MGRASSYPKSLSISSSAPSSRPFSGAAGPAPTRLNIASNTLATFSTAPFALSFTRPRVVRWSNSTTRITRFHVGEKHRLLLALVHEGGEFVLADHLGELVVGAEIGGGEGSERGGIELGRVAHRGDELAGAVHQQRAAGVRVAEERLQVLLDLLEVALRERPARRTRHHALSLTRTRPCPAARAAPARSSHRRRTRDPRPPAGPARCGSPGSPSA